MRNRFLANERGVEPTALVIMAGVILLAIGLSIGVAVYKRAGGGVTGQLSFSVTLSPSSATIGRPTNGENTKNVQVSVQKILDYSSTVTLSCSGNPIGVTVTFSPSSGTPNFGSTMTVHVDNNYAIADLGKVTTITVRGAGADTEQVASFELTVA